MKSMRLSTNQKIQLIIECRKSGLSDYQWCKQHEINPSTFYNWVNRMHKQGIEIPGLSINDEVLPSKQEVVKLDLLAKETVTSTTMNQKVSNTKPLLSAAYPAVEITLGNATIRFFNETDPKLIETTFRCLGGVIHVG